MKEKLPGSYVMLDVIVESPERDVIVESPELDVIVEKPELDVIIEEPELDVVADAEEEPDFDAEAVARRNT